jgi:Ca2+-binding RTX toxin-like protein
VNRVTAYDAGGGLLFDAAGLSIGQDTVLGADFGPFFLGDDGIRGGAANDVLEGYGGDDTIDGGAGDDTLRFGPGDDRLLGGAGRDTAWSQAPLARFSASIGPLGLVLSDASGALGRETIGRDVERVRFPETSFALDLGRGESGGDALALLFAAFDAPPPPSEAGRWIAALDRGASMPQVAQQMLDAYLPGGVPTDLLASLLFANLLGRAPTPAELASLVALVEGPAAVFDRAGLVAAAADLDVNRAEALAAVGIALQYDPLGVG